MQQVPFRYRRLGYIALNVPDLAASVDFYRDVVGLELTEEIPGEAAYFRCGPERYHLALHRGEPGLKRLAFELESDADLDAAARHLDGLGVPFARIGLLETAALHIRAGLRFAIPGCGIPTELYTEMELARRPYQPTVANILRLGHTVLLVEEFDTTYAWLTQHFGFVLSDHIAGEQGEVAFMRCYPNPYHHSLGIARAERNQFHHVAFMVEGIDDIGKATNRLASAGSKIVFGPGRHVASGSVFLYFLDPNDLTIEYTLGMEEFAELTPRPARDLPGLLEVVDLWGGRPQPGYAGVGVVAKSD
jgi:2,3-dihydroxy-p-cumate/2,3-dihydroxybenzoate 3,4-dioxygenase